MNHQTQHLDWILNIIIVVASLALSYVFLKLLASAGHVESANWYIQLFFGDEKAYFFNVVPMTVWVIVQILKFIGLSLILGMIFLGVKEKLFSS